MGVFQLWTSCFYTAVPRPLFCLLVSLTPPPLHGLLGETFPTPRMVPIFLYFNSPLDFSVSHQSHFVIRFGVF